MHVKDYRHVLRWRQPLPRADISLRDVPSDLRRHLFVQVQGIVPVKLDKSHGDKQSITIVVAERKLIAQVMSRRGLA